MSNSTQIYVFEKQVWKQEAIFIILLIGTLVLGVVSYFVLVCCLVLLGIYLLVKFNWRSYSVLNVYDHFMICYNPLLFWQKKKLFDYQRIINISIYRVTGDVFSILKISHKNGSVYTYAIETKQIERFKSMMRQCKVDKRLIIF